MALTFDEAQSRINLRFPSKNLVLKSFDGVTRPLTLHCPLHGDQRVSNLNNLEKSAHGCPECGRESSTSIRAQRFTDANLRRRDALKTLEALRSLDPSIPGEQYKEQVLKLLQHLS